MSAAAAERALAREVRASRWSVRVRDWLEETIVPQADLILSAMVLEHFDDLQVRRYFAQTERALRPGGLGVVLVPASPAHWGIEDEVAGHVRRYTRETLREAVEAAGFSVAHLAGLTYPVSNFLLRLSNRQVRRWEADRVALPLEQRTRLSGRREVPWKTSFPFIASVALNETALLPLHALQLLGRESAHALVLYCEFARGDVPAAGAASARMS